MAMAGAGWGAGRAAPPRRCGSGARCGEGEVGGCWPRLCLAWPGLLQLLGGVRRDCQGHAAAPSPLSPPPSAARPQRLVPSDERRAGQDRHLDHVRVVRVGRGGRRELRASYMSTQRVTGRTSFPMLQPGPAVDPTVASGTGPSARRGTTRPPGAPPSAPEFRVHR